MISKISDEQKKIGFNVGKFHCCLSRASFCSIDLRVLKYILSWSLDNLWKTQIKICLENAEISPYYE